MYMYNALKCDYTTPTAVYKVLSPLEDASAEPISLTTHAGISH